MLMKGSREGVRKGVRGRVKGSEYGEWRGQRGRSGGLVNQQNSKTGRGRRERAKMALTASRNMCTIPKRSSIFYNLNFMKIVWWRILLILIFSGFFFIRFSEIILLNFHRIVNSILNPLIIHYEFRHCPKPPQLKFTHNYSRCKTLKFNPLFIYVIILYRVIPVENHREAWRTSRSFQCCDEISETFQTFQPQHSSLESIYI